MPHLEDPDPEDPDLYGDIPFKAAILRAFCEMDRGEILEQKTEAYIDGIWYTISRNRMTYNAEGKRTSLENLAGQITTTAWDCCHKVSETEPDGSTTTFAYDQFGSHASVAESAANIAGNVDDLVENGKSGIESIVRNMDEAAAEVRELATSLKENPSLLLRSNDAEPLPETKP